MALESRAIESRDSSDASHFRIRDECWIHISIVNGIGLTLKRIRNFNMSKDCHEMHVDARRQTYHASLLARGRG